MSLAFLRVLSLSLSTSLILNSLCFVNKSNSATVTTKLAINRHQSEPLFQGIPLACYLTEATPTEKYWDWGLLGTLTGVTN